MTLQLGWKRNHLLEHSPVWFPLCFLFLRIYMNVVRMIKQAGPWRDLSRGGDGGRIAIR